MYSSQTAPPPKSIARVVTKEKCLEQLMVFVHFLHVAFVLEVKETSPSEGFSQLSSHEVNTASVQSQNLSALSVFFGICNHYA